MITFDLTTPVGRRACVLWHVGRGLRLRDAADLAGVTQNTASQWRIRVPGYAAALDDAKRRGGPSYSALRRRRALLDRLRAGDSVQRAARAVGISRSIVYIWRSGDTAFAAVMDSAQSYGRRNGWADPRAHAVAAALASGTRFMDACRAAGVRATTVQNWRRYRRREWAIVAPYWAPRNSCQHLDVAA